MHCQGVRNDSWIILQILQCVRYAAYRFWKRPIRLILGCFLKQTQQAFQMEQIYENSSVSGTNAAERERSVIVLLYIVCLET